MKKDLFKKVNRSILSVVTCISLIFISCDSYNFSVPQPMDKQNIIEFPASFLGTWKAEDENDFFKIETKYVTMQSKEKIKIVKGAWPKLNAKGDFVNLPSSYKSFYTIQYDSMKIPHDTTTNYLLEDNNIYEINEDGKLGKANTYLLVKDTFMLNKNEVINIDLGRNAFLRKLNEQYYTFNIISSILGDDKPWWQILIVQVKAGKELVIWDCTEKLKQDPSMFYHANSSGNYYFNAHWTSQDLLRLMGEGKFSKSGNLYPIKKK